MADKRCPNTFRRCKLTGKCLRRGSLEKRTKRCPRGQRKCYDEKCVDTNSTHRAARVIARAMRTHKNNRKKTVRSGIAQKKRDDASRTISKALRATSAIQKDKRKKNNASRTISKAMRSYKKSQVAKKSSAANAKKTPQRMANVKNMKAEERRDFYRDREEDIIKAIGSANLASYAKQPALKHIYATAFHDDADITAESLRSNLEGIISNHEYRSGVEFPQKLATANDKILKGFLLLHPIHATPNGVRLNNFKSINKHGNYAIALGSCWFSGKGTAPNTMLIEKIEEGPCHAQVRVGSVIVAARVGDRSKPRGRGLSSSTYAPALEVTLTANGVPLPGVAAVYERY